MTERTDHEAHDAGLHAPPDGRPVHADGDHRTVVEERVRVEPVTVTREQATERKMSGRSFVAGFLTAVVAAAVAFVVFLAVTDSDNDGEIEVDVPTVDVDVDG